jgi:hypothetical protein
MSHRREAGGSPPGWVDELCDAQAALRTSAQTAGTRASGRETDSGGRCRGDRAARRGEWSRPSSANQGRVMPRHKPRRCVRQCHASGVEFRAAERGDPLQPAAREHTHDLAP